jgi:hypothetical protein
LTHLHQPQNNDGDFKGDLDTDIAVSTGVVLVPEEELIQGSNDNKASAIPLRPIDNQIKVTSLNLKHYNKYIINDDE